MRRHGVGDTVLSHAFCRSSKVGAAAAGFAFLLLIGTAHAGVDDIRTVVRVSGQVQVRGAMRTILPDGRGWEKDLPKWTAAKVGMILFAGSEVRTGPHSTAILETGDQIDDPAKFPSDSYISYEILEPNTRIKTHDQHGKQPILEVKYGKVRHQQIQGRGKADHGVRRMSPAALPTISRCERA